MIIQIKNLERYVNNGEVIIIYYRAELTDNYLVVEYNGSTQLDPPDPNNFIPYEQITQEMAMQWLMNKIDISEIETYLQNLMSGLKNPPTENGIPWQ
jgi:hypothetical protein